MTVLDELVIKLRFPADDVKTTVGEVKKLDAAIAASEARAKQFERAFKGLVSSGASGPRAVGQASALGQALGAERASLAAAEAKRATVDVTALGEAAAKTEKSVFSLRNAYKAFLGLEIVGWVRQAGAHVLELASNTQEVQGALGRAFGAAGQADIEQWASATADGLARSQFQLREFSSQLGAMLSPMLGSKERALELSKALSTLAVDLGAAFNTSDEEALTALRSGLSGEAEPLKKYGVILLDATLKEFAHAQGIKKKFEAMNVAEKTELRYQYIMKQTALIQGAAAAEAGGYAGRQRAFNAQLRELGTNIGLFALPAFTKLLDVGAKFAGWLVQVQKYSKAFETAGILALVVGFGRLTTVMMAAWRAGTLLAGLMAVGKWLAIGVAIFAVVAAFDELWVMLNGGRTVIGLLIDKTFGLGAVDSLVRSIGAGIKVIQDTGFFKAVGEAVGGAGDLLTQTRDYGARQEATRLSQSSDPNERALGERSLKALGNRGMTKAGSPEIARALGRGVGADAQSAQFGRANISALGGDARGDVNNIATINVAADASGNAKEIAAKTASAVQQTMAKHAKQTRDSLAPNRGAQK